MSSQFAFNDNALARALGSDDPVHLAEFKAMLEDPASTVVLSMHGDDGEIRSDADGDPVLTLTHADVEIDRVLAAHDPRYR